MSLLNVSLNFLAYLDEPRNVNPNVRMSDLNWSLQGMNIGDTRNIPITLAPGETQNIISSERVLSYTGATSFQVTQVPNTSYARLNGSYGARAARSDGDATTEWTLTLTGELARLRYTGTGTAPIFPGMMAGDGITLDAGFAIQNQGDFTIVRVSTDYVEFMNPNAVPETVLAQAQIYSSGPVQVGDILDISSSGFSYPNRGSFPVLRVTDSFIEFVNPRVVPETVTGVSSGLTVYLESYLWMLLAVDRKSIVRLNGDTGSGTEVQPMVDGDLVYSPGLFLKRGKVYRVDIMNPGLNVVRGFLHLAE